MSDNHLNQIMETVLSMRIDAECNEINPTITFNTFYEDYTILIQTKRQVMNKRPPEHYQMLTDFRSDERFGIIDP